MKEHRTFQFKRRPRPKQCWAYSPSTRNVPPSIFLHPFHQLSDISHRPIPSAGPRAPLAKMPTISRRVASSPIFFKKSEASPPSICIQTPIPALYGALPNPSRISTPCRPTLSAQLPHKPIYAISHTHKKTARLTVKTTLSTLPSQ